MAEYLLPDVGEGLTEAEIVAWKVKVGDVIAVNDIVVEIETAKSLVELPSPYAGTVTAILVEEGTTVAVGTPIIAVGDPSEVSERPGPRGGSTTESEMEIDLSNPAASGGGEGESLVGRNKADRGPTRRPRRKPGLEVAGVLTARADVHDVFNPGAPAQHEKVERIVDTVLADAEEQRGGAPEMPPSPPAAVTPAETRVLAKPPVRKLAKDLGVDLATVTPTGPDGTVTRADVEGSSSSAGSSGFETGAGAPSSTSGTGGARETREPIKGVRKMMAGAMTQSAFTAPHVTEWVTIDATRTMELVDRLKKRREFRDVKVSPLLVLARASILAMRRTPEINSFWDEAAGEVVLKHYVNLGIAAATPRGLVVPNVKDAQDLSLLELATALNDLAAVAREGRTQPAEMSGGTFTITNVGVFGVDAGTPIINPGESAILCFGAVKKQPWVVDVDGEDQIEVRQVTTLALSFDHRHIDGEKGSRFLADVAGVLEDPATAMLF
ncbi:dihydrolipoamide acetyltransferase family protein [Nocardioides sp.]|uniref:dihydrolipoamide acetyltransferase family protein n=1 Tax=Nocardioides sp. TaxID=35761 RepID=UPI001A33212A|nr:dihydrolipoamide acetyltransferase family protein [Nocardioides sp.]MBJ7356578.1 2-oxo acid dehydrogenase subunit E2 [Nocardioides sp.]